VIRGVEKWEPGYTAAELEDAQARFGLRFPPDLHALLRRARMPGALDWTRDDEKIRAMLAWPLEGILFDVEEAHLWWPEWGERPAEPEARAAVVAAVIADAPKLIPLFAHRYLPEEPFEAGNPVFSVYQSDIIFYGSNLPGYIANEFSDPRNYVLGPMKHIRFWSDAVARSWDPAYHA
jgi:hypothetical protein